MTSGGIGEADLIIERLLRMINRMTIQSALPKIARLYPAWRTLHRSLPLASRGAQQLGM
jgi:hypothetical protein